MGRLRRFFGWRISILPQVQLFVQFPERVCLCSFVSLGIPGIVPELLVCPGILVNQSSLALGRVPIVDASRHQVVHPLMYVRLMILMRHGSHRSQFFSNIKVSFRLGFVHHHYPRLRP